MPLVNYRGSEEAVLHEIHEVTGRRQSAKQVLSVGKWERGNSQPSRVGADSYWSATARASAATRSRSARGSRM